MQRNGATAVRREHGSAPLYQQVCASLREAIAAGVYPAHSALPPEPDLCDQFGVSRVTLRRAMDELIADDLVSRRHGAGTFVKGERTDLDLTGLRTFIDDLKSQSPDAVVASLGLKVEPASAEVARRLGIAQDDPVISSRNLLSSHGEPAAIVQGYYSYHLCPGVMAFDPTTPAYEMLARLGLKIAYASQTVEASLAGAEEAKLLGIRRGMPLLLLDRITYLAGEVPVNWARAWIYTKHYKFRMVLRKSARLST